MKILVYILLFSLPLGVFGQFQISTYQLGRTLPQSNLINPAISPDAKVAIGLPGLSSIYVDVLAPASFSDLIKDDGNSFSLDPDGFVETIGNKMRTEASADVNLLYFGTKIKSGYFSLSLRARLENKFFLPGDLAKWALYGPADSRTSNTLQLDDIDVFGANYIELGASYNQKITPSITFGLRLKYLSGIVGVDGSQSGYIHTSIDSTSINVSNLSYQVSGYGIDDSNWTSYLFGGNSGFGADIGVDATVTNDLRVSASITDMGVINWKNDVEQFTSQDASYSFSGFEIADLISGNTPDLQAELDSIAQLIEPVQSPGSGFRTGLNPKLNLLATYEVAEMSEVGFVIHTAFNKGNIDPVIGINHTLKLGRVLHILTGAAYKNGKFNNITGGFMFKPGPVQLYFLSDRINSLFYPARAHTVNLRFGMNLMIGRPNILGN